MSSKQMIYNYHTYVLHEISLNKKERNEHPVSQFPLSLQYKYHLQWEQYGFQKT